MTRPDSPPWLLAPCALVLAAALAAPHEAAAQVACADLPNPVYLQVGDTQEPLMKALGQKLRAESPPITLVYKTSGSCTNIEAIYRDVKLTANPLYVPSAAEDAAWDPSQPSPSCSLGGAEVSLDIANSALFVSACTDERVEGIELIRGPNQAYVFAVPEASTQRALTAEEAYFVFGFGAEGQAAPWTDEAFYFIRPVTKSTLLALAAAIEVPGARWKGQRLDKSTEVVSALAQATAPEKAIGILGAEIYDGKRGVLNALAFRAYGQRYAYYPDSTATALDKRNVRDGHYFPWSPTVWLTRVDTSGAPVDTRAGRVIDLILGREVTPAAGFEPLDVVISKGLVPECAMSVTRDFEGGPLIPYEAPEPCDCYYQSRVPGGGAPASCHTCTSDADCDGGKCRHTFCEAR